MQTFYTYGDNSVFVSRWGGQNGGYKSGRMEWQRRLQRTKNASLNRYRVRAEKISYACECTFCLLKLIDLLLQSEFADLASGFQYSIPDLLLGQKTPCFHPKPQLGVPYSLRFLKVFTPEMLGNIWIVTPMAAVWINQNGRGRVWIMLNLCTFCDARARLHRFKNSLWTRKYMTK